MASETVWIVVAFVAGALIGVCFRVSITQQTECTLTEEVEISGHRVTIRATAATVREADEALQRLRGKLSAAGGE